MSVTSHQQRMDIFAGVDEGPLGVLHWFIWFWYEAGDFVHFASVAVWVISVLLEEWLADVLGFWSEFLFVIVPEKTVHSVHWQFEDKFYDWSGGVGK